MGVTFSDNEINSGFITAVVGVNMVHTAVSVERELLGIGKVAFERWHPLPGCGLFCYS